MLNSAITFEDKFFMGSHVRLTNVSTNVDNVRYAVAYEDTNGVHLAYGALTSPATNPREFYVSDQEAFRNVQIQAMTHDPATSSTHLFTGFTFAIKGIDIVGAVGLSWNCGGYVRVHAPAVASRGALTGRRWRWRRSCWRWGRCSCTRC